MKLFEKMFGKNGDAAFADLAKVKAAVETWRREFSQLTDRVLEFEAAMRLAHQEYFANPSAESFDKLVAATVKARESRAVFNENAFVSILKTEQIVETPAVHELLKKLFKQTATKLRALADQAEADDKRRCAELGIAFEASPTARELRRKVERVEDGLVHIENGDDTKPRWHWAGVLESL